MTHFQILDNGIAFEYDRRTKIFENMLFRS